MAKNRESLKDSIVSTKLTPKVKVVQSRISYSNRQRSNQEGKKPDVKPSLFDLDLRKAQAVNSQNALSKGGTLNLNSVRPPEALQLVKEASTLAMSRPPNDDFDHFETRIDSDYGTMHVLNPRDRLREANEARPTSASKSQRASANNSTM